MATAGDYQTTESHKTTFGSFSEGAIITALETAAADDGFQLQTGPASTALEIANYILTELKKSERKKQELLCASAIIVSQLKNCIPDSATSNRFLSKANREKMWSNFHALICSESFQQIWISVLGKKCACLSQFLSRQMLDSLLVFLYPPLSQDNGLLQPAELTSSEENALRYAAGYVVHSVKEKWTQQTKHPMREAILYGLSDMCLPDGYCDTSEDWLNLVDRGGLTHINHTTFKLFFSLEMELRQHLSLYKVHEMNMSESYRQKVVASLVEDVDVQHYISLVAEDLEDDERKELLAQIVALYVTIRGFSFVKSWLERYKQEEKKKLQKSKSLRSKLSCKK